MTNTPEIPATKGAWEKRCTSRTLGEVEALEQFDDTRSIFDDADV
jgi:hypothetical protein